MRRRRSASGRMPAPASAFSRMCSGRLVPGITQVTDGCAIDVLQEDLRPGATTELRRPGGQRPALHAFEQSTPAEWQVHQHGDAAIGRQRQQPLFRGAVVDRVVELYGIERLGTDDRLQRRVGIVTIVRDPEVTDASLPLPRAKRVEVRAPVHEIVDLHQLDARMLQLAHRGFHLRDTGLAAFGPHLRGHEGAIVRLQLRQQRAGDVFGRPVHG